MPYLFEFELVGLNVHLSDQGDPGRYLIRGMIKYEVVSYCNSLWRNDPTVCCSHSDYTGVIIRK